MMRDTHSFTRNYGALRDTLISECQISAAWSRQGDVVAPRLLKCDALWDTGATISAITEDVAKALELRSEASFEIYHAQGSSTVPFYHVDFGLPNGETVEGVMVSQGVLKGCDVIIGMDIINKGDFAVTNRDGITVFSFRMPSIVHIDFEEQSEDRKRKDI